MAPDRPELAAPPLAAKRARISLMRRLLAIRWLGRDTVLAEVLEIRGLMPLLMKCRNGCRWTAAERAELHRHLRTLIHLVPWLVILVLPGSVLLIPLIAWWLDRRRHGPRDSTP